MKATKDRQAALKVAIEGESTARSGRSLSTANNNDKVEFIPISWSCASCTFKHIGEHKKIYLACELCGTERVVASTASASSSAVASSSLTSDLPQQFVDVVSNTPLASSRLPEESTMTAFEIQDRDCDPDYARVCLEDEREDYMYEDERKDWIYKDKDEKDEKKKKGKKKKRKKKKKKKKQLSLIHI